MFKKKVLDKELSDNTLVDSLEELDSSIHLPSMVLIGFYEGVTKKALFEISKGYVNKYFDNPYMTNYRCKKHNNGYIYEIHDGSKDYSYIDPVIKNLALNGFCYLLTRDKTIKVMEIHGKIQSYVMPVDDVEIIGDKVQPTKSKTYKLYTESGGFLVFGLSLALIGVISLFVSSILKYVILDENKEIAYNQQLTQSPLDYFEKLPIPTESTYTSKIVFTNGAWKTIFASNPMPTIENISVTEKDIVEIEKGEIDSLEVSLLKDKVTELLKQVEKLKNPQAEVIKPTVLLDTNKIEAVKETPEKNITKEKNKNKNNEKINTKKESKQPVSENKIDNNKLHEKINLKNLPSNVVVEKL